MKYLKQHKHVLLIIVVISLLLIALLQVASAYWQTDALSKKLILDASYRLAFGILLVIILYYLGLVPFQKNSRSLLWIVGIILPGFIISMNNFPLSAYLSGRTTLNEPQYLIYLFAIDCLAIGFLEEIVFRGIILVVLIQRLPQIKNGTFHAILIASALFGLVHLVNLFSGASPFETVLQTTYSFLMGALWSVVYLATKNLLYPILLHATYNFFGLVLFQLGSVTNRFDLFTFLITLFFAILASLFYYRVFDRLDQKEISSTFSIGSRSDSTEI